MGNVPKSRCRVDAIVAKSRIEFSMYFSQWLRQLKYCRTRPLRGMLRVLCKHLLNCVDVTNNLRTYCFASIQGMTNYCLKSSTLMAATKLNLYKPTCYQDDNSLVFR